MMGSLSAHVLSLNSPEIIVIQLGGAAGEFLGDRKKALTSFP